MADDDEQGIWISSGGCERCDSMDGLEVPADDSPVKPHPNCNCTIQRVPSWSNDCDENRMSYQIEYSHPIHHDYVDGDSEFDLVYDYEITCPNGEKLVGQVSVSMTYDEMMENGLGDADIEALEMVDNIAASDCEACPGPPLVS